MPEADIPSAAGEPAGRADPGLGAIAATVRAYESRARDQVRRVREIQQLRAAAAMLRAEKPERPRAAEAARGLAARREALVDPQALALLARWTEWQRSVAPGTLPVHTDHGDILAWWLRQNLPDHFPYTARSADAPVELQVGPTAHPIATLDDMRALCRDIDLTDASRHVRVVLDGSPPVLLAMLLAIANDQRPRHGRAEGAARVPVTLRGSLHANAGAGASGWLATPQLMAEAADYLMRHRMDDFAPFGIGGPRLAQAGVDPAQALAEALAEGLAGVEVLLAHGLAIDVAAPLASFWAGRAADPALAVAGRVARRIWAIAMRDRYGAGPRAQSLRSEGEESEARSVEDLTDRIQAQVLEAFDRHAPQRSALLPEPARDAGDAAAFLTRHTEAAPSALRRLAAVRLAGGNVFDALVDAVDCCTAAQLTRALSDTGAP